MAQSLNQTTIAKLSLSKSLLHTVAKIKTKTKTFDEMLFRLALQKYFLLFQKTVAPFVKSAIFRRLLLVYENVMFCNNLSKKSLANNVSAATELIL